jgi:prepilin-type processing-associated H-X9-DG protein
MDTFTSLAKMEQFNHSPGGSNVLYLDGHAAFMRYNPSNQVYPMVESVGETMALLRRVQQGQ